MNIIKQLIELVYYYRADQVNGKPYWQDPAVIGLIVSLVATELAKLYGLHIDADLQLKIVAALTGIGALVSPHTGLVAKKAAGPPAMSMADPRGGGDDDPPGQNR